MAMFMENYRKNQTQGAAYMGVAEINPTQEALLISEAVCTFRDLKNNCLDELMNLDARFTGEESDELIAEGIKESFANMLDFMIKSIKKFIDFIVAMIVKFVKGSTAKIFKNLVAKIKANKDKTLDAGKDVPDSMKAKVFEDNRYPAILIKAALASVKGELTQDIKIGKYTPDAFLEALKTYTESYNEDTKSVIDITTTDIGKAIAEPGELWKKEKQEDIIQEIIKANTDAFASNASDEKFKVETKDDVKKAFYDAIFNTKKELSGNTLRDAVKAQVTNLEAQLEHFGDIDEVVKSLEKEKEIFTGLAKSLEKAVKEARKKVSGVSTKETKDADANTMTALTNLGKIVGTYGAAMVQVYAIYDIVLRDAIGDAEKVLDLFEKMVALKGDKKGDKKEEDK